MTPSARLGGFKILKEALFFALVFPMEGACSPGVFFQTLAHEKVNLPYTTCLRNTGCWGVTLVVEGDKGSIARDIIKGLAGISFIDQADRAVLSIFPHRKDPGITGSLFQALHHGGVEPDALANSPSAISVVLNEASLGRLSRALFEPFSFSAYRTPEDWKLAQQGKEELYKEVVASYQEKRPKVYGLEVYEGQEMTVLALGPQADTVHLEAAFKAFALQGLHLTFLATGPGKEISNRDLVFCLPTPQKASHRDMIRDLERESGIRDLSPVAVFSMNGPHFGDRYGIVSELLAALEEIDTELLGLSCTIASVTGVVAARQIDKAIEAIQSRFEVPSIIRKKGGS